MKTALTIAGSDSSGGAGIQADLKAMTMNGVFAMSAITALTAQNTTGVSGIYEVSPAFLAQQIDAVFTDIRPCAVKIGMVSSAPLIETIAERLRFYKAENIVVDPVMVATSGSDLIASDAVRTLQQNLKTLGYYDGSVTGNFGRLTKEAVYNFQKANGLKVDGAVGPLTLAKLDSNNAVSKKDADQATDVGTRPILRPGDKEAAKTLSSISGKLSGNSSSGNSSSSGSSNSNSNSSGSSSSNNSSDSSTLLNTSVMLQQGSSSSEVLKLQNMLASLGFYTGNKTGNFGALTADAVMAYQKSKGLTADGIAGKKTLAAINADYSGKGSTSAGTTNGTTAPSTQTAGNVIYENFYNWRRNYANGEYCTVYDFSTGYSWKLRIMTKDAHMDAEPATAEDTAIMLKAFGGKTTWTPKAVWVTFSDGKTYIGSTHDVPHSPQHLSNNNFNGHLCVHFPISMEKAQSIGPYATSHQEAINEGWAATQKLKY